jgi:hypothetical protein
MTTMASRFLRESIALLVSALALTGVAGGCSSSTDDASPTACGQLTCGASQWCLLSTASRRPTVIAL